MPDDERDPADAAAEQPPDEARDEPEDGAPEASPQAPSEAEAWVVPPPPAPASPDAMPAHAVPATPLGEGTRCPRCGTDNRPGIAFCRSCGQRLMAPGAPAAVERPTPPDGTQACPRCGTHNRAGVAFCQNCGANLRPADPGVIEARAARSGSYRAILGPVVLLIGAAGLLAAWLLPFAFGGASLWDRSFGAPGGYRLAFWLAYPSGPPTDAAYFGLAAPVPVLLLILVALAAAGFVRAAPGRLQRLGLVIALAWGLGLVLLFLLVELLGEPGRDLVQMLRTLSPGGIIFLLAGLIVVIGSLTRLWRA
ncbi:MAG: zinc ribbon domain-containing protein [Chloroflexota bacterium]|nr:zinc ribbon domain-containing protein [Chloroflexota bacterium]